MSFCIVLYLATIKNEAILVVVVCGSECKNIYTWVAITMVALYMSSHHHGNRGFSPLIIETYGGSRSSLINYWGQGRWLLSMLDLFWHILLAAFNCRIHFVGKRSMFGVWMPICVVLYAVQVTYNYGRSQIGSSCLQLMVMVSLVSAAWSFRLPL